MKYKRHLLTISLLVILMLIVAVLTLDRFYHTPPAAPQLEKIRHFQGVTEYRLSSNGLSVLLIPDTNTHKTTVNMTYKVGSMHEQQGQEGLAHLLEHMLFRATGPHKDALAELTQQGVTANAFTTVNSTNFIASFTTHPETLESYLRWQAQAMTSAKLLPEDLQTELTVVRNELEQKESSPAFLLHEQLRKTAFQTHPYRHSTLGQRRDLSNITAENLREFYARHYRPDNAVLVIAGNFDQRETLEKITTIFGAIPQPKQPLQATRLTESVQQGERRITLRSQGGIAQVQTLYHGPSATEAESANLHLVGEMLFHRDAGRLNINVVKTGLASSVEGESHLYQDVGLLIFSAHVAPGRTPFEVLDAVNSTVESLAAAPFTEQEFSIAKQRWLHQWSNINDDKHQLAKLMTQVIAQGDWRLWFYHHNVIHNATLSSVQSLAEKYLVPNNRTEGLFIPSSHAVNAPSPIAGNVDELLAHYASPEHSSNPSPAPDEGVSSVHAFEPTFEFVQANTDVRTLQLQHGTLKLALLPKPSSGQQVRGYIRLNFGDADSLRGKVSIAAAAATLLSAGNASLNYSQIESKLAALKSNYQINNETAGITVKIDSNHDNIDAVLRLIFRLIQSPDYPQQALTEWIQYRVASAKESLDNPESVARTAWRRHASVKDPLDVHYEPSAEEFMRQSKAVTRDAVVKFHEDFYGANHVQMVLVGDFEADSAVATITQALNDWKPGKPYQPMHDEFHETKPAEIQIQVKDKTNASLVMGTTLPMNANDPNHMPLRVASYIFGASPDSRLWRKIRQQEGLTYGVTLEFDTSLMSRNATWYITTNYAPSNRQHIVHRIQEEFDRTLKEGFTEQELKTAKKIFTDAIAQELDDNESLAYLWLMVLLNGHNDLSLHLKHQHTLQMLTLAQINEAFQRYIQPDKLVRIYAGDFSATQFHKSKPNLPARSS